MNEFDKSIQQAQKKQFRSSLLVGGVIVPVLLLLTLWLLFGKGYHIVVEPEQARQTATFDRVAGIGLFFGDKLYSLSEEVSFTTLAKGYIAHTEALDKHSAATVPVVLQPKPGRVVASTIPQADGIAWYVDDKLVVVDQTLQTSVPAGQHRIRLDSPYHQVLSQAFEIGNDEEKVWAFELVPIDGLMIIDSRPQGADVSVNGEMVGQTPLQFARPGGKYRLSIGKAGYVDSEESIELTNRQGQISRDYRLAAKQGFVTFALEPMGGTLLVDGKQVGNSQRVAMTANQAHSVWYQRPGYYDHKQTVTILPGDEKQLHIALQREMGKVMLTATPTAQVIVDGKFLGLSPLETRLSAVPHQVQFKKQGYRLVERQITPNGKTATLVDVALLTEYQARRRAGKPTVAQSMGIEMAAFRPDKVIIGSRVNETGRRRNEFLRRVEFTRGIAVSRHEISEAQYAKFSPGSGNSNLPVSNISWTEAAQFCNWLSGQEGLTPFYQFTAGRYQGDDLHSQGYRLPTEAEWEWLARRAKRAAETTYVWGNSERLPKQVGNLSDESAKGKNTFYLKGYEDGYAQRAPVGSFKADRAGLHDLVGNVSEWVHDRYSNIPPNSDAVLRDPLGSPRGNSHLFKGASYDSGRLKVLRTAYREPSADKAATIGFRIARWTD